MLRRSASAAALALALAVPVSAQMTNQSGETGAAGEAAYPKQASTASTFVSRQKPSEWRGSKLIGASVYGPDNESIGDIDDVIVGPEGQVHAVVIGFGGFLGIGEKNVAVPFQALRIQRKVNASSIERITIASTKQQFDQAPKFAFLKAKGAEDRTGSEPKEPPSGGSNTPTSR